MASRGTEDEVNGIKVGEVDHFDEIESTEVLAKVPVTRDDHEYNMKHRRRGKCLVFCYESFQSKDLKPRKHAKVDIENLKKSFGGLGFQVETFHNQCKEQVIKHLEAARQEDHSDCDCFALVFMSHGSLNEKTNKQQLHTYDLCITPEDLWTPFAGSKCPSLLGKPKLFFIQACRGTYVDKGTAVRGMRVETDNIFEEQRERPKYALPSNADVLLMWATFPGYYAFGTENFSITGSVFIHFLCEVLTEEASSEAKTALGSLLVRVSRRVALMFESSSDTPRLDGTKQQPYIESSLLRDAYFYEKRDA